MSYTEIYAFNEDGYAYEYGETRNAWRSAPIIWKFMEEKYLPPYIPNYVKCCYWYNPAMNYESICKHLGYHPSRFPDFSKEKTGFKEICDLVDNENVSTTDKIVLHTTFDYALVKKQDFNRIISAFQEFEAEGSSLLEQAEIFKEMMKDNSIIAAGWNQTSVNCDNWANFNNRYCINDDKNHAYNCLIDDKHYWIFDEVK